MHLENVRREKELLNIPQLFEYFGGTEVDLIEQL